MSEENEEIEEIHFSREEMETCTSLAEQLGEPYRAMHIGKIRKLVCDESDLDGTLIKPTGVLKIMAHIKKDMDMIESAKPETVWVRTLHHKSGNPRRVIAEDLERKRRVSVLVPMNRKRLLDIKGKKFKVNRGSENGEYTYRYPAK